VGRVQIIVGDWAKQVQGAASFQSTCICALYTSTAWILLVVFEGFAVAWQSLEDGDIKLLRGGEKNHFK
jgi:hypothetical protein